MRIQIILIGTLILTTVFTLKVSDFQPSLFKFTSIEQGFRNIDTGSNRQGQVIVFSDLDGDRFTDYIGVESRQTSNLIFYLWSQERQQFIAYTRKLQTEQNIQIQEIIVYDFNQDGDYELLITTKNSDNDGLFTSILFKVRCTACNQTLVKVKNSQIYNQTAMPFLMDNNKDQNVQIFAFVNQERLLHQFNFSSNSYIITEFSKIVDNSAYVTPFKNVSKHFAANIDLNNDCVADLALVSNFQENGVTEYLLEIFQRKNNNRYQMVKLYTLDNDLMNRIVSSDDGGQIEAKVQAIQKIRIQSLMAMTFADIDHSGTVDFVFLSKFNDKIQFKTLLNKITPADICKPFSFGIFPSHDFDFTSIPDLTLPSQFILTQQSIPHFNDVNSDGLPDILMLMKDKDGYDKVSLLINQGDLNFNKYDDQWKAYDLNNPHQVLFYDYADDGKMDLMIISESKKEINGNIVYSYTRTSVINNLQSDTLHLKILPLSITSSFDEKQKKTSSSFGVTIQWLFTDIDGHKIVQTANQKYQMNYGLMQLPYAYAGLGRTNNYVQQLTVGYQVSGEREDWTPIIPNSQLMVYRQDGEWKLETLLRNNERVNDIIYISILILLLMGVIIFYLNYKQSQEDKRDHYNFIQLIR